MSIAEYVDGFLVKPHTLKVLSGRKIESDDILADVDNEEIFRALPEEAITVEVMTLAQHKHELAFEELTRKPFFGDMDFEDIGDTVEEILPQFEHVKPHVKVFEDSIVIVIDCDKLNPEAMELATKVLAKMPASNPGFYWEYLEEK